MTSRQLAGLLQVSDRTIRSDVEAINKHTDPPPIESNVRQGYRLCEEARPALASGAETREADIPQTPGARCAYMIQKLLFEVKELNLTMLQSQIYVSGYSIDNDLKRIRKMLEPYSGLKLVRNKECISLKGDEASKRRFYRDLLVAEVQENFLNLNTLAHLYRSFNLIEVKDIFVDVLEEYDYSIHESMFPMLILHAGTSIERMNCANYINMEEGMQGLEDTIEYQIAQTFFDRISKRLHITVHDGEVGMFALVIMGRRASNYTSDFVNYNGKWMNTRSWWLKPWNRSMPCSAWISGRTQIWWQGLKCIFTDSSNVSRTRCGWRMCLWRKSSANIPLFSKWESMCWSFWSSGWNGPYQMWKAVTLPFTWELPVSA